MKTLRRLPVVPPDAPQLDRRRALLAGAALFTVAGCPPPGRGDGGVDGSADGDAAPTDDVGDGEGGATCPGRDVGAVADFPVDTRRVLVAQRAFLFRDARGFWCVTATCTHFGGPLEILGDGTIHCTLTPADMHGSTFNADGHALTGPALTVAMPNLANFLVSICGDRVFVSTTRFVPAGTRVAAP